jgi:CheY-like chemotaxis protein
MLRDAGHDIVEVESAREALSLIEDCAAFDLILTDHLMPGMTGAMLVQKLKATHPSLPLVLITGYVGTANDIPEGLVTVHKPVRQAHLLRALDEALSPSINNVIRLSSFNKD